MLNLLRLAFIVMPAVKVQAFVNPFCNAERHPVVILPGIMASQISASYNGLAAGSPCVGRKSMHTVWPPTASAILPTGLSCWLYMIQTFYDERLNRFTNNKGVKVMVQAGGRSGTEYGLWQSSYSNLTTYLSQSFGYVLGKDMFGAPFDWRLHLSGQQDAGGMRALATRVEAIVRNNCGKKAVIIGHSMGALASLHLLHSDHDWAAKYIHGYIAVSAPFGGTTDQAIAVRMGSVEFDITDWVKMPMAKAAAEVKAKHSADVAVAVANIKQEPGTPAETKSSKPANSGLFNLDRIVSDYISSVFYKATIGLPGLSMLLPYASAYGSNRRIIVTKRKTYTASMMKQLMEDIGDSVTVRAWQQVQELEGLLDKGPVPAVPTHCIYATGKTTSLTWSFPNIAKDKPLLKSSKLVTTGGDGTVSMQSLKQCYRVTDSHNITEVGEYGHLEILKAPETLDQVGAALKQILGIQDPAPEHPYELTDGGDAGLADTEGDYSEPPAFNMDQILALRQQPQEPLSAVDDADIIVDTSGDRAPSPTPIKQPMAQALEAPRPYITFANGMVQYSTVNDTKQLGNGSTVSTVQVPTPAAAAPHAAQSGEQSSITDVKALMAPT